MTRSAAVSTLTILVAAAVAVWLLDLTIRTQVERELTEEAHLLVRIAEEDGIAGLSALVTSISRDGDSEVGRFGLRLGGGPVIGNLREMPPAPGWSETRAQMIVTVALADGLLSVSRPQALRRAVRRTILVIAPLIAVLQTVASIAFVRTAQDVVTRQIDAMESAMDRFSAGRLDARIPRSGPALDRFDDLAERVNADLARIEQLIGTIRRTSAAIAHDLRTPLSRVSIALQTARTRPAEAEALLAEAGREIAGMVEISEAVLRLSEIDAATGTEGFSDFDLAAQLRELCETYHPVLEDRGGAIACDGCEGGVFVHADRRLLFQALANLVENAIRHAPRDVRIRLCLAPKPGGVRLAVEDDGPGVPGTELERIFEPHFRLDASRGTAGSGLGLALVRAVAERHSGRAAARATKGDGLTVVLDLPIRRAGAEELI